MKRIFLLAILLLIFANQSEAVVTGTTVSQSFTCNGTSTTFPFSFPVYAPYDLTAQVTTAGQTTTLASISQYSVSVPSYQTGGTLTLVANSSCPSGSTLTITRVTPETQNTVYANNQYLNQLTLMSDLDKLWMSIQEQTNIITPIQSEIAYLQAQALLNTFSTAKTTLSASAFGTDLSSAITAIGTANVTLVIDSAITANETLSVPSNIQVIIQKPGLLTIATGCNVAFATQPQIGPYQVFSGSGTVNGLSVAYPEWWYAGGGDYTSAVNTAIASLISNTYGGELDLSQNYNVTSVNASRSTADFTRNLTIKGNGKLSSGFVGTSATSIVLDCIGANDVRLEDFSIGGVGSVGLLLARSTTSQNCSRTKLKNINIDGSFSIASHAAIAAESSVYNECRFANSNSSANYTTFITGEYNDFGITSTNGTLYASANTSNKMYGCEFYAPYNNVNLVVFDGVAGYSFYGCEFNVGSGTGGNIFTYQLHTGQTVYSGPTDFYGCHIEGNNPTVHNLACTANATDYFYGIHHIGGYTNIYTNNFNLMNYNSGGTTFAVLGNSDIKDIVYNATANPSVNLYVATGSTIDLHDIPRTSILTITGYQSEGYYFAYTFNEAGSSVNYRNEFYGTAAPSSGTYAFGDITWNTGVTAAQYYGLLGWRCVVAGTPGTWVPLYTGGAYGPSSGRPGGTLPIGFMYFDTTKGFAVWWNGSEWINSAGVSE